MNRLLCYLLGHQPDIGYADFYDLYKCERCGKIEPDESWPARMLYRIRLRYHWRIAVHLERRPDCGVRGGRHDPEVEHGPF